MASMETVTEKARSYLDARRGERVTLEELAAAVGASPFHLQRRFKEAFGVSPKAYQEAHRVEAVKSSLRNGSRVTDALFEAGYGSVSRFYEKPALGMRASAYRAAGRGQSIRYCWFLSPLGAILVAATDKGICSVKLGSDASFLLRLLKDEFKEAKISEDAAGLKAEKQKILDFLDGDENLARVPVDIRGTVFQRKVWEQLRRIPAGETRTYKQIARAIGAPDAVRAVGSACGANPVALLVPCHRAVRTDGGLGGYAWGLSRKKKLLDTEKKAKGS
jgi:AraC family transcriptional regulator of adaptative response/methylated-DNA-[protein]-cysteine methyltransferase